MLLVEQSACWICDYPRGCCSESLCSECGAKPEVANFGSQSLTHGLPKWAGRAFMVVGGLSTLISAAARMAGGVAPEPELLVRAAAAGIPLMVMPGMVYAVKLLGRLHSLRDLSVRAESVCKARVRELYIVVLLYCTSVVCSLAGLFAPMNMSMDLLSMCGCAVSSLVLLRPYWKISKNLPRRTRVFLPAVAGVFIVVVAKTVYAADAVHMASLFAMSLIVTPACTLAFGMNRNILQ